ncbi:MAG TPA: hypothetical protein VMR18_00160 [Candidatus Saccharimonadales bacterium]|jgi:hypothetical protein|nr:hypothetical protein [Candidatus Saccharimonadales bacterium]
MSILQKQHCLLETDPLETQLGMEPGIGVLVCRLCERSCTASPANLNSFGEVGVALYFEGQHSIDGEAAIDVDGAIILAQSCKSGDRGVRREARRLALAGIASRIHGKTNPLVQDGFTYRDPLSKIRSTTLTPSFAKKRTS